MKRILIALLATTMLFGCDQITSKVTGSKSPEALKAELVKVMPGLTKIDQIDKSPIPGIDEVIVGRKVFYVTSDGKYLFFGNLIDIASKKSLTEEKSQQLNKVEWKKLPLSLAIKDVIGNGKRKIAVFSDPDCPYCQMFEKQVVPKLTNTTVYTFLFPLPMHPNAKSDATKIWCSKNPQATWAAWMRHKQPLPTNVSCDTSDLAKIYKVGTDVVGVEGTPTIILENGTILPGMLPADQLMAAMDKAEVK